MLTNVYLLAPFTAFKLNMHVLIGTPLYTRSQSREREWNYFTLSPVLHKSVSILWRKVLWRKTFWINVLNGSSFPKFEGLVLTEWLNFKYSQLQWHLEGYQASRLFNYNATFFFWIFLDCWCGCLKFASWTHYSLDKGLSYTNTIHLALVIPDSLYLDKLILHCECRANRETGLSQEEPDKRWCWEIRQTDICSLCFGLIAQL